MLGKYINILDNDDIIINKPNEGILLNFILTDTLNSPATTSLIARKNKLSITSSPNDSIVNASP